MNRTRLLQQAEAFPRASIAERIAEQIRAGVRNGQLVPGQHLIEADLTRQLGVSRSSLREALRHLHGDGIIAMHRYRGTHICRLSRKEAEDLLEVLEQLVRLAARRAAGSPGNKRHLGRIAAELGATDRSRDQASLIAMRRAFYDALFDLAGSDELPRVTPMCRADLFRVQILPYQGDPRLSGAAGHYRQIAQAVLDNDAAAAETSVGAMFSATRALLQSLPAQAFET